MAVKSKRICPKGHTYHKSSDCPVCPVCEEQKKSEGPFYFLAAPARRAVLNQGIKSLKELARFSEKEILSFHGMGPASIPKLKEFLKKEGLSFRR